jgi:hypothetical protein
MTNDGVNRIYSGLSAHPQTLKNGDLFSRGIKRVLFQEADKSNLIYSHVVSHDLMLNYAEKKVAVLPIFRYFNNKKQNNVLLLPNRIRKALRISSSRLSSSPTA